MFQDDMVLQRQPQQAVIWGFGDFEDEVIVLVGEEIYTTTSIEKLETYIWRVTLNPQPPGGPHTIKATQITGTGEISIELENVLFGDVWLCSGQSNMGVTMNAVSLLMKYLLLLISGYFIFLLLFWYIIIIREKQQKS